MKLWVVLFLVSAMISAQVTKRRKDRLASEEGVMDSMICPSCDRLFCTVKKANKLKCTGGVTTDICGCCPVCAKLNGEKCGGEWNYLGKCDVGLYCKAESESLFYPTPTTKTLSNGIPEGHCEKIPDTQKDSDMSVGTQVRSSLEPKCQPKCTPEFCDSNPRAICSAVDVVDMKRDCQGRCQHTSCQACTWVDPDPDCGACPTDDFNCIKNFAKCVKRYYCSRSKFPCKLDEGKMERGKFQCMVPKCPGKS